MKKLLFFIAVFIFTGLVKAQSDCTSFFPSNKGAMLINKTYDGKNNLLSTMVYTITKSSDEYMVGDDMQIDFTMTDSTGNAIDRGNLEARCDGQNFYLSMVNRAITPEAIGLLGQDTELVGDFLDYPNTFAEIPYEGTFEMDGGEFAIRSKSDKKDLLRVKVYNRQYEKDDKITTPAGTFDASKISFDFEVYNDSDKKTTRYSGAEWYAAGAGIVRTETVGDNKELLNYTVLTEIKGN